MQIIDLSQPISDGMAVYPGDPRASIRPALSVEQDGVAVARLDFGSHTGTHLDAPSHVIVGGRTVDQIPLEWLIGPAAILRVSDAVAAQRIDAAALDDALPETLPRIVCVQTGWDRHFGSAEMLRHPYLALELAEQLWARGARVLGVDALSPDPTADLSEHSELPVHEFWLGGSGVVVENLRGLSQIAGPAELSLLPLALHGGDGAPIRAVARV
ncbi:kynurenine formamidase [Leucobacter luti]|uniref:Kynurenine formamidase n=1 Tax=Leucobacter luti TaxID=340320 RepID=A0A4R6RSB6_9MICO|nr:cyclase family protein [Leucobacter luti]TDP89692.1 kynurenine formamidase [Leucobacter luti]